MEDTGQVRGTIAGQNDDFVVRQFSPTRIERLLLTRLFDLTTGGHVSGDRDDSPNVPWNCSQTAEAVGGRREAA